MTRLSICVLGPIRVRNAETDITAGFRTDKERALLIYLAQERDRPRQRQALAEMLWPNKPEGTARTNLRQALSGLRRALGDRESKTPHLLVNNETVRWNPDAPCWLDFQDFLERIQSTSHHVHTSLDACPICIPILEEAVHLYKDDFLCDVSVADAFEFQEWVIFHREHYFRQALSALQALSAWYTNLRDYENAFQYARRLVNLAPLEESAHRQVMRLQALTGRRSAALEQYATFSRMLGAELGAEPDQETTRLYRQIKSGQFVEASPIHTAPSAVRLPVQLTHFVGRETELQWIEHCLASPVCRLLSIVGLPGIGKTRLAVQGASLNARFFPDGVHLVSLSDAPSGRTILDAVVQELKLVLAREHNSVDQLLQYLRPLNTLLILDGVERYLDQTWLLIDILRTAPGVKMIATTRQRLNYQSACLLELSGLPFPTDPHTTKPLEFPAVQLLVARARRSRALCSPTPACLKDAARIAQLTGGMPLAIELAAAHLSENTCTDIVRKLEDKLDILSVSLEDVPLRHRDLPHLLQELWESHSASEQDALRRLAVFPESFDITAAQAVTGVGPTCLSTLANHSLLEHRSPERYGWPPLSHRFVRIKLAACEDELKSLQEGHFRYYLDLLHAAITNQRLGGQVESTLERVKADLVNIHTGLRNGLDKKEPAMAQSMLELQYYYQSANGGVPGQTPLQIGLTTPFSGSDSPPVPSMLIMDLLTGEVCCDRLPRFDDMENGLLLADSQGRLVDANYQAVQMSGYPREVLLSMTLARLVSGSFLPQPLGEYQTRVGFLAARDGSPLPVTIRWESLVEGDCRYILIAMRPEKEVETPDLAVAVAAHDPLTGLLNRTGFYRLLDERLAQSAPPGLRLGVVLLTLDNLKDIYRNYGLAAGDQIIQEIASRLQGCIRSDDRAALVGVDEFALFLSRLSTPLAIERIITRVLSTLNAPYQASGEAVEVVLSTGVCFYPDSAANSHQLLAHADLARSQARALGKNRFKIYGSVS